jgi:molybdate transport system substrate-binding protein
MIRRLLLVVTALAVTSALATPVAAQATTVYAATSLRDALPGFDKSPSYSFAGSNVLQLQVERGAPADLFASASPVEAQALHKQGRCEKPVTFATNILVLLVPSNNPGNVRSVHSLRSGGRRLAVGSSGVPIGAYTRLMLRRLGLSSILQRNTVSDEANVGAITTKVSLGSADAGFAYLTDARSAGSSVRAIRLPKSVQPPVRYQACVVKRPGADTAGATAFLKRLTSGQGRSVLKKFGFGLPARPKS